jgi:hypothetical protein
MDLKNDIHLSLEASVNIVLKVHSLKNDKTIVAYFVEYTVEKFEKFLII